jgi:hypothetical protein
MKKQKAFLFLEMKSILFNIRMSAVELKQLVKSYVAENEKVEIICLAELGGHKVLFIPPIVKQPTTCRASLGICKRQSWSTVYY